jgi:adenylate cyclase
VTDDVGRGLDAPARLIALAAYGERLAAASRLEAVFDASLTGLDEVCGGLHALLLVHQPELGRLVTVASHGYPTTGTGSEVALGEGVIGMVAARRATMRIGNLQRMLAYARTVRRTTEADEPADEIRLPGLTDARSQLAAPMVARGSLVGVLAVESSSALAYDELDERALTIAAHLAASAVERELLATSDAEPPTPVGAGAAEREPAGQRGVGGGASVTLRHYAVDGSTFLDDTYVIKGVAGRLLWKVVAEHAATGRTSFTNREAKLDRALELPEYRDNFESRLILLKRRLDEHEAAVRIRSSGRGRFELDVLAPLVLQHVQS